MIGTIDYSAVPTCLGSGGNTSVPAMLRSSSTVPQVIVTFGTGRGGGVLYLTVLRRHSSARDRVVIAQTFGRARRMVDKRRLIDMCSTYHCCTQGTTFDFTAAVRSVESFFYFLFLFSFGSRCVYV